MEILTELQLLTQALNKADVPYALCGGLAVAAYGHIRATEDIDLMIEEISLPKAREVTATLGFRFDPRPLEFREGQIVIYRFFKSEPATEEFLVLDLLMATPVMQLAWRERRITQTEFGPVSVLSPAGLIHMKTLRNNSQDQEDIRKLKELSHES